MNRLNIGCGMTPTKGWRNFDNSLSIWIAKFGPLGFFLHKIGLINKDTMSNIKFCQSNKIEWADVSKKIPVLNSSTELIYTSHMLEHLDREEALSFLKEAHRVLCTNGIIRIAIPDIRTKINDYLKMYDADLFIESIHMGVPRPKTFLQKMRMLIVGTRHHQWMYDGASLSRLLITVGFADPVVLAPGVTTIKNPGDLDLAERIDESVYVEARK